MATEAESRSSPAPDSSRKRKSALPELEVDLSRPEPPSKKAKRALKKGKPLPAARPTSDGEEADGLDLPSSHKKAGSKDGKSAGDKKDRTHFGVWVGNLPFTLTRPELFRWLVDNSGGSIAEDAITRVNLPASKDRPRGRDRRGEEGKDAAPPDGAKPAVHNKGFAYVDFATYEASVAAIALSETELAGRRLLIKDNKSFEGRPAKGGGDAAGPADAAGGGADQANKKGGGAAAPGQAGTNRKVFVGNLAFNTNEDDLWAHFAKCGPIDWVKVATFEDTGKCKGYAWVRFHDAEAAAAAVKGFVKIKEEVPTEDDFAVEAGATTTAAAAPPAAADANSEREEETQATSPEKPATPRKVKMRKWWVNTLLGRSLKIELAEEDQVRYKRRFGKDAVKGAKPAGGNPDRRLNIPGETKDGEEDKPADKPADTPVEKARKPTYRQDINVARLTGAAVMPQGKKTSLE